MIIFEAIKGGSVGFLVPRVWVGRKIKGNMGAIIVGQYEGWN